MTSAFGTVPPSPADMFVFRINLEPGGRLPSDPSDPSVGILIVESGALTLALEGSIDVTRGAGLIEAMATAEASGDPRGIVETFGAGDVVTLTAGDAAYVPGNLAGEIRNEGQELAVGLAFLIYPAAGMERRGHARGLAWNRAFHALTLRAGVGSRAHRVHIPDIAHWLPMHQIPG